MAWRVRFVAALLLALVLGPGSASAHLGGTAYVLVLSDFILPGESFEVIAADMGPSTSVELAIVHEPTIAALGTTIAAPDGHLTETLVLPGDFPGGYAQLFATATVDNGVVVSTWVLVGEPTSETAPPPNAVAWWADPSVLVLAAFVMGALAVFGYLLLRPRPGKPVPARASRAVARKRRTGGPRAGA